MDARSRTVTNSTPRTLRWMWFVVGWVCFSLGAVGVVLPVLPTTPFMILALGAFARSSPRFRQWLYQHRLFGPSLRRWAEHRIIPLRVKLIALAAMALSLIYVGLIVRPPWYAFTGMVVVMAYGAWFISTKPHRQDPDAVPRAED
ncbi:MAG: YbaN family protein [Pseudomonadota bacterium]